MVRIFSKRRLSPLLLSNLRPNAGKTFPLYAYETFDLGVPPTTRTRPHSPRNRQDRQVWPGYRIYHNRDDSISFGTEEREYFGWLPAEVTRAVPESLINAIASMVCHAHRVGRKEHDFLQQFVLEQMRVLDWPHYPMNDLRKMTPPPLPPTSDK